LHVGDKFSRGEQVDANEEQSGEHACEESVDKQLGGVWLRCCSFILGLVCFKENEFLEFIFLTFPCLATLKKNSQWKLNSSQQKNTILSKESVFRRIKKGKHFPFHKSRSLSLS